MNEPKQVPEPSTDWYDLAVKAFPWDASEGDAVLDARRRMVQVLTDNFPEPCAECPQCHRPDGLHKLGCGERFGSEPQGEPSSEVPEPSAEWSDASVIAALTAYDPDGFNRASWTEGAISDMRAALIAASAAKKAQREHEAGQHISDLIERSSLGTTDAQALRATVSDEKAQALVAEAHRRSEPQGEPSDCTKSADSSGV